MMIHSINTVTRDTVMPAKDPVGEASTGAPSATPAAKAVHLPVLAITHDKPPIRSGLRRYRYMALASVYVFMIAHVAHWLLKGKTLGPVVFSETMYTLEAGRINAGFIFFATAILVTLVFGRFFCGWACHMAGLQELCAWGMNKFGVRPRHFRSRILGYTPLCLALYLFLWPTLKREAVYPLMTKWWPQYAAYFRPVQDFPGLKVDVLTTNLWSPLPGIFVALFFLLTSGVAIVTFLGARGLCRYGCPYGGVFRYAEQLAPGRVTVNADLCNECGRCTAICSLGINVMEETLAYGRIVSKDCVRSLDCVSVCPTKALSFKFGAPAVVKGLPHAEPPKIHYDATLAEELLLVFTLIATLMVVRGLYGIFSLLLAVSISLCAAFVVWRLLQLYRKNDVRQFGLQLKRAGRLRPAGYAFVGLSLLVAGFVTHSAVVQSLIWRAERYDNLVTASKETVYSGNTAAISDSDKANAASALKLYHAAASTSRGGIGLAETPAAIIRESWLNLVTGNYAEAEAALRIIAGTPVQVDAKKHRILGTLAPTDQLAVELSAIMQLQGKSTEVTDYLTAVVTANPTFNMSLDRLAGIHFAQGRPDEAQKVYERALEKAPNDGRVRASLAILQMALGRRTQARTLIDQAVHDAPKDPTVLQGLARINYQSGDIDGAVAALRTAAKSNPADADEFLQQAASILRQVGRTAEAEALQREAAAAAR